MTTITIKRDKQNRICAFEASGHSNSNAYAGTDIHCAAISAIVQTAAIGLTEYAKAKADIKIKDGYLSCKLKNLEDASNPAVAAILETMQLGLESFSKSYGKYIRIIEEVL